MSGNFEHLPGWSRGCTPPQECCRLPPTHFCATWLHTGAFLISMKNENLIKGWFDNTEKGDVSAQLERLRGWSRGSTPPQDHCQLPPTYFWVTWHQTRAFLISMRIEKRFLAGWIFLKKQTCLAIVSACRVDPVVSLHHRNTAACRLPPTYFWTT